MIRPLVIMALSGAVALAASPGVGSPIVVELFTSEGCSSCLPADRFLERMASNPQVIILSEHVDYWDTTGWKDPFSSPLFSTRQMDYAKALKLAAIPTPQVVVNGEKDLAGPNFSSMAPVTLVATGRRVPVSLKWVYNDTCARKNDCTNVTITVGKLPEGSHKSDVLLAIAESKLESTVLGGENAGKKLIHAGVVRSLMQLAEVDPAKPGEYTAEARLNLRSEWVRNNLKIVVFVQDRENRRILGAASVPGLIPTR